MTVAQRTFSLVVSVLFLILVIHLIRKKQFDIKYSIVWLAIGATILVLSLADKLLLFVMRGIGAKVPTTPLFIFAILFLIIFGLQISVQLTQQATRIKTLTQELALLRHQMELLKEPPPGTEEPRSAELEKED